MLAHAVFMKNGGFPSETGSPLKKQLCLRMLFAHKFVPKDGVGAHGAEFSLGVIGISPHTLKVHAKALHHVA